MAAIGFLLGGYLLERELDRVGENKELAGSIIISAIIGGIVGSKIYFLFENPGLVKNDFFGNSFLRCRSCLVRWLNRWAFNGCLVDTA